MRQFTGTLLLLLLSFNPLFSQSKKEVKLYKKAEKKLANWRMPAVDGRRYENIGIDTFLVDANQRLLWIRFSNALSYKPIREELVYEITHTLKDQLGRKFRDFSFEPTCDGKHLETFVPNYFRNSIEIDSSRFSPPAAERIPVVRRMSQIITDKGLYNRNIALWNSHGRYYESQLDRWEWQRARLYSTVEDLFPTSFVLPYLVPMLENAGANVFIPRERDTQIHEVIVDNDRSSPGSEMIISGIEPKVMTAGYLMKDTLFHQENPFSMGSYLKLRSSMNHPGYIDHIPNIYSEGNYAVYISYQQSDENISDVRYTVFHSGGKTEFLVNQRMGGGTWIYLGTFHFNAGKDLENGFVRVSAQSNDQGWITTDAIRFGGGMGNIARRAKSADSIRWKISGKPRYQEGARYYLQYAGAPDTLVYYLTDGVSDYNDDYQSRGEWVNYLMGAPNGPNKNRDAKGLKIPIDLSLAFHTDAGTTPKDSTIGTLAIYSSVRDDGKFLNGQSKMVNRDLADIIQSEIVHDIQKQFNPFWTRRAMWDKEYSEAWRPNVPSMLLELLSHQNLTDMRFGHDPGFKFAVSRAIYKGIVKFLAFQHQTDYSIQPLPVDHFAISRIGSKRIKLNWQPVLDSLEPSASPTQYKVYQRIGNGGFDNGQVAHGNSLEMDLPEFGEIYSYKVTAINDGGESFPSEILSVGLVDNEKTPVLVVNAFDRVSAPAIVDEGHFAGLAHWEDEGVADKFNIGYTGAQYDFDRNSPWIDDDSPGWGASYGDMEGKLIPGNSFDNTFVHGSAIMVAERSFVSISDEAFSERTFDLSDFQVVDLIFGEEKTAESLNGQMFCVFDAAIIKKITEFTRNGGNVMASGAYLGTDHILNGDTIAQHFAHDILHFKWRTNHAVKTGEVYTTDDVNEVLEGKWIFNTTHQPTLYKVEAPDALEPVGANALTAFRYEENNSSAGVIYNGNYKTLILGFPLETIILKEEREDLMKQILQFLK
jgi:hypothetical protein